MTGKSSPIYELHLRPMPDNTDPDGIRRLRRALKCLGRSFRLRCVYAKEITADNTKAAEMVNAIEIPTAMVTNNNVIEIKQDDRVLHETE